MENGSDIAGMGGLMGTAMAARNFSGAVIDGGVRDTAYLQKIGFPVYALGVVPSTSIGQHRFAGANVPVTCDGVPVNPGDIIVADADGVVVVPKAVAPQVLKPAQDSTPCMPTSRNLNRLKKQLRNLAAFEKFWLTGADL